MKMLRLFSFAACALALLVVGCGKKDPSETTAATSTAAPNAGGASDKSAGAPPAATGRPIEITGNDAMKFSVTEIRAKPGETLSVTLVNVGTMPKFSMGHNWVLMKQKVNIDEFLMEGAQAPTTDYLAPNRKNDMLAHTKLLGPKERDTVTFQAPKEPGRYTFLCSFPGHYQVGMKGELIVE